MAVATCARCGIPIQSTGLYSGGLCQSCQLVDAQKKQQTQQTQNYEKIQHSQHYNQHPAGVECIDIIEHFPANIAFAMKHLWRAGWKPNMPADEDLEKAIWYIRRERERLGKLSRPARLQDEGLI